MFKLVLLILMKIIAIIFASLMISYSVDRIKGRKENIGLDNAFIFWTMALIVFIVCVW